MSLYLLDFGTSWDIQPQRSTVRALEYWDEKKYKILDDQLYKQKVLQ